MSGHGFAGVETRADRGPSLTRVVLMRRLCAGRVDSSRDDDRDNPPGSRVAPHSNERTCFANLGTSADKGGPSLTRVVLMTRSSRAEWFRRETTIATGRWAAVGAGLE
jgi:hypothetical protein